MTFYNPIYLQELRLTLAKKLTTMQHREEQATIPNVNI